MYRNEECSAGDQLFVVEIAGGDSRRSAVDLARGCRRRNAHASEKGLEGKIDPRREVSDHTLPVERDDLGSPRWEHVRKKAGAPDAVVRVGHVEMDAADANLEYVPRLRARNRDRPRQQVAPGSPALLRHSGVYRAKLRLDLIRRHTRAFQALRGARH